MRCPRLRGPLTHHVSATLPAFCLWRGPTPSATGPGARRPPSAVPPLPPRTGRDFSLKFVAAPETPLSREASLEKAGRGRRYYRPGPPSARP